MAKLSVVIPSREERFLVPTIDDIFAHAAGEIEVIAVLDSDKWPLDWKSVTDRHPNLHTIHNGKSIGMRGSINKGVASAISRGAKFIMKLDAHCGLGEGFDEILKSACEPNWIVVPRRKRLNPETWELTDTNKPDVDYHYLSFPNNPDDFGGPGLNGKIWPQRAVERKDILIDDEMSSQGSGWFMHAAYFTELELMDEASYGKFWNEFQELGLKCWLSGGQVKVNKNTWYSHWHKGKAGRGYRLEESQLQQGASFTKNWIWNDAWPKQTKPFEWLIDHFWPVPTWPENWREVLYAQRKPRAVGQGVGDMVRVDEVASGETAAMVVVDDHKGLRIISARYGPLGAPMPFREHSIDVAGTLRSLVKDGSLDVIVNNSTLAPGQNPYRGKKKVLLLTYSIDGGEPITIEREEKDWLIIGLPNPAHAETRLHQSEKFDALMEVLAKEEESKQEPPPQLSVFESQSGVRKITQLAPGTLPMTAPALNDYLIRRFQISPQRLRGPMPIELRDFYRNDLAQLFAELGFKRGAEIGVAEGHYSEVVLKANPDMEWLMVDPWGDYEENPQGKGSSRHEFALEETKRKTERYKNARMIQATSMEAVRDIEWNYLDAVYVDGNHLFDYCVQDLIEWSKRVRSGGIVSGDDYYALDQKRWVGGGVVEAVQAYTNAHRIPIWYIFQGHKSTDFMWVKP